MQASPQLIDLSAQLGNQLKSRGWMLTTAESCTGGLVGAAITEIAGSSAWFERGFVTYSNLSKIELLGVSPKTLEQYGAVSEATAKEMAEGALKNSRADIAVSITGIAGPDGGSAQKPVGTVCFAWASKAEPTQIETQHFDGNRAEIRHAAAITALSGVLRLLSRA